MSEVGSWYDLECRMRDCYNFISAYVHCENPALNQSGFYGMIFLLKKGRKRKQLQWLHFREATIMQTIWASFISNSKHANKKSRSQLGRRILPAKFFSWAIGVSKTLVGIVGGFASENWLNQEFTKRSTTWVYYGWWKISNYVKTDGREILHIKTGAKRPDFQKKNIHLTYSSR